MNYWKSEFKYMEETKSIESAIGKAIKAERKRQGLTQEQLGERMGIQKARVSKIESGKNISYSTVNRTFKALGATSATLDLGDMGRIALW